MDYKTHGVCSSMIHVELDGDKIKDVDFVMIAKRQSDKGNVRESHSKNA